MTGKTYTREDGAELKIRATFVDSGWQTQEVYHRVKQYKYLHWFAIKGQAGDKPLYSKPSAQETNYRGEKVKRGISIYKVGVDVAKQTLYARSQIETPGANYINFPNDLDKSFYEGFCSEVLVTKHKNGHPYHVWEVIPGIRNEPLDLCVYALAAAHMAGITRMNLNKLEGELQEQIPEDLSPSPSLDKRGEQDNDRSSSDHMDSNVRSSQDKAPNNTKNVRSRARKRRRSSNSNFTTNIY